MKKIFGIFVALTMVMALAGPAATCGECGGGGDKTTIKDNNVLLGCGNTGINGNKNHHNIINSGDIGGGDAEANASSCAFGIGIGGKGGNATATIEKGAVKNTFNPTNVNVNCVKNEQDQSQEQANTQTNTNTQTVGNNNGQAQSTDVTVEGDTVNVPRSFATGVEMTFPNLGTHYGPDAADGSVLPLPAILSIKPTWTRATLKANLSHTDMKMRSRAFVPRLRGKGNSLDTIEVKVGLPDPAAKLVGITVVEADDIYTTNLELMSQAALDALSMTSADTVYIVIDGASRVTKASGWGVGFNQTVSSVAGGDARNAGVSTGGTGYSSGKAGYRQVPWIQVFVTAHPDTK